MKIKQKLEKEIKRIDKRISKEIDKTAKSKDINKIIVEKINNMAKVTKDWDYVYREICKAKLQAIKEYEKDILEMIDDFDIGGWDEMDSFEVWFKRELKSKINEVKKE